jgi:hypothetical protein
VVAPPLIAVAVAAFSIAAAPLVGLHTIVIQKKI